MAVGEKYGEMLVLYLHEGGRETWGSWRCIVEKDKCGDMVVSAMRSRG